MHHKTLERRSLICVTLILVASGLGNPMSNQVVDLIDSLRQRTQEDGMSLIANFEGNSLSFIFEETDRTLQMPKSLVQNITQLFQKHVEFSVLVTLKQRQQNVGSIIAFTYQNKSMLELASSGQGDEIRFHYSSNGTSYTETMPYRLADDKWHKLAISISDTHLSLYIDCYRIYDRTLLSVDKYSKDWELWLGQRSRHFSVFKGSLRDFKLVFGSHGYLLQCPGQDTKCPACGQFGELQQIVQKLSLHVESLENKVSGMQNKITELEKCECTKSCLVDGTKVKNGEVWRKDMCTVCSCQEGNVNCTKTTCPQPACKYPIWKAGECCPVCLRHCYFRGRYYEHGEDFSPRPCVTCSCQDGQMACRRLNPLEICPKLNCSIHKQVRIPGQCCPICPGTDFCSLGHKCHPNASCVNLATKATCHCSTGFYGDGSYCKDIDECLIEGGDHGHHCQDNSICVNTVGSYQCECKPGFFKNHLGNCHDVDECSPDAPDGITHGCHDKAACANTRGSYSCECTNGYQGDGFSCEPKCSNGCANGGTCILPETCACPHGFYGKSCQKDINECTLDISSCSKSSKCINTPGAYMCECLPGFQNSHWDNRFGQKCIDIDECSMGNHTCHPSEICVNIPGDYMCICDDDAPFCSPNCMYHKQEYINGTKWHDDLNHCSVCDCLNGVVHCNRSCNCSEKSTTLIPECCPECDKKNSCHHQELSNISFKSGEKWTFNCQTCKCVDGETNCWKQECPEIKNCDRPTQNPGECCPHCEDDTIILGPNPCNWEFNDINDVLAPCNYHGEPYKSADIWKLKDNNCVTCQCKAGHICCLFHSDCELN